MLLLFLAMPSAVAGCTNECYCAPGACASNFDGVNLASDGVCDDGGEGAEWLSCARGNDCADCGARLGRINDLSKWIDESNLCEWEGITCNGNDVTNILLAWQTARREYAYLSGTIPSTLSRLSALTGITLFNSKISGSIPSMISQLNALDKLMVHRTYLSGTVPPDLSEHRGPLQLFTFYQTLVSGTLPHDLSQLTELSHLTAHTTSLSGTVPPSLLPLSKLEHLQLEYTAVSGTLPALPSNLSALQNYTGRTNGLVLKLSDTKVSGTLPPTLDQLALLVELKAPDTALSGTLPPQLSNLSFLYRLWFQRTRMSGTLPPAFGQLSRLYSLFGSSTRMSGTVPPTFAQLSSLTHASFDQTSVSGTVPSELSNAWPISSPHPPPSTSNASPPPPPNRGWIPAPSSSTSSTTPPPPSPSPPPPTGDGTAEEGDEGSPCFPNDAVITMANGTHAPIHTLKAGDAVVAITADGSVTLDTISILSLADREREANFVSMTAVTDVGQPQPIHLTVTPEHHVPAGVSCCSHLVQAKALRLGETIWVHSGKAVTSATIKTLGKVRKRGLHSPVLVHGHNPVVDSAVTAFDSATGIKLMTALGAYVEPMLGMTGTTDAFRRFLLQPGRKYIDGFKA